MGIVPQRKVETIHVEYGHHRYTVEFRTGGTMRFNSRGKYFPFVTQCLVFCDGEFLGFGEVLKADSDVHDPLYGKAMAAKKAFAVTLKYRLYKGVRNEFWKLIGHPVSQERAKSVPAYSLTAADPTEICDCGHVSPSDEVSKVANHNATGQHTLCRRCMDSVCLSLTNNSNYPEYKFRDRDEENRYIEIKK